MFQEGLFSFLSSQSTITAILGASRSDKTPGIFPMLAIQEPTLPYIVYQGVGLVPEYTYEGQNAWQQQRFRFSCYASSQKGAWALARALKMLFATYTGTFSGGYEVQNVMLDMEADDTESVPHGTIYAVHVDYTFSFVDV